MTGKTRHTWFLVLLGAFALALAPACVGGVPGDGMEDVEDPDADNDPEPDPDPDPDPDPQALNVSGKVHSYFKGVLGDPDPLAEATVETEGINPVISATADLEGDYMLPNVPAGSVFYAQAHAPEPLAFLPTRNESVTVVDESVEAPLYAVAEVDMTRWYTTALGQDAIYPIENAAIILDLYMRNGDPLAGVELADITLLDALGEELLLEQGLNGGYSFNSQGDVDPNALASLVQNNMARYILWDIPPGTYELVVAYENELGDIVENLNTVMVDAGGVTLVKSGGLQGPPPPAEGDLTFEEDIYPLLQKASQGGDACANCHTAGGVAGATIQFDLPAADVELALLNELGAEGLPYVDLGNPADSLLLTKPLYEDPPNHPNATYPSVDYPSYVTIMTWIQQMADAQAL